ncbi:MAG: hypothetical protein HONDAALG_03867 [Gammaproteobacteria bacterium]|nr:hypothetical protein [Gammaproteobacteria bacterium]
MKTVLSFGMGVESSALLLRWLEEPESRDFDLERDLIVITSQTGGEYPDTKKLCEEYLLPRIRQRRVRYVQVARAGHLEADGVKVLSDTRQPFEIYLQGAYTLQEELSAAGTVPQFAGERRCSLKFKAWVIETWLARELSGQSYRHALGYNADEQLRIAKSECAFADREATPVRVAFGFNCDEESRIARAAKYDTELRRGWYPLAAWGWSRERCLQYLKETTGATWRKSACVYCPFNALKDDGLARMRQFPEQVAEALMLEYQSLALNPRGMLYRDRTLHSIIAGDHHTEALLHFQQRLEAAEYALYRVRRIYRAPGHADRAVEKLVTGSRAETMERFEQASSNLKVSVEHDISYGYVREREPDRYPTVEEFFVVAPAAVESKTRYGFDWFEAKWREALGETRQERLFT